MYLSYNRPTFRVAETESNTIRMVYDAINEKPSAVADTIMLHVTHNLSDKKDARVRGALLDQIMTSSIAKLYLLPYFQDTAPYKVSFQQKYRQVPSAILSPYMRATPVMLLILASSSKVLMGLPEFSETLNEDVVSKACKVFQRALKYRKHLKPVWTILDSGFFDELMTVYRKHYGPLFKLFGLRAPEIDREGLAKYAQGIAAYESALMASMNSWVDECKGRYLDAVDETAIIEAIPNKMRWLTTGNMWMRLGLIPATFTTRPPFLEPTFIQVLGNCMHLLKEPMVEVSNAGLRVAQHFFFKYL